MSVSTVGYSSKTDTDLVKDFIAKTSDMYLQKYEHSGTGTLTVDSTALVITDTTASFTADELVSTQAYNLYIVDDDGDVCKAKITDNSTNQFVITAVDTVKCSGSNYGSAGSFTNGSTYEFNVLTPDSIYQFGRFFGYTKDKEFDETEEMMAFKYGVPRKTIREDLLEAGANLTGTLFSTDFDTVAMLENASVDHSDATYHRASKGFQPASRDFYKITFVTEDVDGKDIWLELLKGQFKINGSRTYDSEEYKGINFSYTLVSQTLFPADEDMYLHTQEK